MIHQICCMCILKAKSAWWSSQQPFSPMPHGIQGVSQLLCRTNKINKNEKKYCLSTIMNYIPAFWLILDSNQQNENQKLTYKNKNQPKNQNKYQQTTHPHNSYDLLWRQASKAGHVLCAQINKQSVTWNMKSMKISPLWPSPSIWYTDFWFNFKNSLWKGQLPKATNLLWVRKNTKMI